jgi:hypothetical protein
MNGLLAHPCMHELELNQLVNWLLWCIIRTTCSTAQPSACISIACHHQWSQLSLQTQQMVQPSGHTRRSLTTFRYLHIALAWVARWAFQVSWAWWTKLRDGTERLWLPVLHTCIVMLLLIIDLIVIVGQNNHHLMGTDTDARIDGRRTILTRYNQCMYNRGMHSAWHDCTAAS